MKKTLATASITIAPNSSQSMRLIMPMYCLICIRSRSRHGLVLCASAEHLCKNLPRHRCRRLSAADRILDQYGHGNLGLVIRRKPDKPAAIQTPFLRVVFGRAGLAGDTEALHLGAIRRAVGILYGT